MPMAYLVCNSLLLGIELELITATAELHYKPSEHEMLLSTVNTRLETDTI